MSKYPLMAFLILVLCAIGVNAAPGFNIIESNANATVGPGQTASASFTVNNTGTTNLNINFTGYTLAKGSEQLSISSLSNITNMGNGTSQSASFSVIVPSQQKPGLYTGTLNAISNASNTDTIAINVNVTPTYSVSVVPASEMNLGSASLNSTHTKSFNITNTGNDNITNVSFGFSNSGFNLQANKTNFVLAFNKTETIEFNITVPKESSTGNVTLGSVTLASTELSATLFSIKADVTGGLEIEDLDVFLITRKSKSGNDFDVPDGRKLNFGEENAGPDSELRFNFNIENTFTDDDDLDINSVTVKVTMVDIDDGRDIEEESDEFDLESNRNEDVDVIIKIPLSVDDGIYDVNIEASGEDDNGNAHTAEMRVKIDIDKEARDVIVSKASSFPEIVKCTGSLTLTAAIKNIGSRVEDRAKLEIINKELGIDFTQSNIKLEEDPFDINNEFTKKLIINVDKGTAAGTYPITVKSYLQEEILWETKTASLAVEACAQAAEEGEKKEEAVVKEEINETVAIAGREEKEETNEEKIPVLEPETTIEVQLTKKPLFWIGVILLNLIIIAAVAFFAVKLVGKK